MTIPAIPTLYRGVQYRSRLEARWAAFFDLLGWKYQYEPFDLEGWIPDFLILGKTPLLIEIKPVTECPLDVSNEIRRSSWTGAAAILGCTIGPTPHDERIALGWVEESCDWGDDIEEACKCPFWDSLVTTFTGSRFGCSPENGGWHDFIGGESGKHIWHGPDHVEQVMDFWNQAGNLTQWRGKQSVTDARR